MRKNLFTLALCTFSFAIASAQTAKFSVLNHADNSFDAKRSVTVQKSDKDVANKALVVSMKEAVNAKAGVIARADEEEPVVEALYKYPTGALYDGISSEGWYSQILMYTPALEPVTFENYSYVSNENEPVTYTWVDGSGKEFGQNENHDGVGTMFGVNYFPTLTVAQGDLSSEFIPLNTTGKYKAVWYGGTESYESLTNASPGWGVYGYFTDGPSFATNKEFNSTGKNAIGFLEFYDKPIGHVFAKSAYILLMPSDGTLSDTPLEGKTLKLTILKGENLETYATATATDADITKVGNSGLFLVTFKFKKEDPLFGSIDTSITLDDDFAVTITGFDNISTSYTALFSSADGWAGNGYAILEDGKLSTVGYSNNPSVPQVNLYIGFNAAIPLAKPYDETTVVDIPVEGGQGVTAIEGDNIYNDYDVYTLSGVDHWDITAPEWIRVTTDNTYLENYGTLIFYFEGDPLPAGEDYRVGEVELELYGKIITVPVHQGNVPSGINGVTANDDNMTKNAAIYNLNGQRVSKNAKGILIQNGKKFINK